ncbi:putative threonine efflux protein [Galbibacter orientalis DSM 19592]|uniref:Putative threonine efflux protein n=1 Tax=Galbibacter orientalis DSM 19592 TaxID=926559 RepID=I3C6C2_9FLAO|nr:LysE family translocator [Galbibacter orientalis]EIJ39165.1 putative threonine efflux protein [Galbibacter orientalis DSM 19592]
MDIEVLTAFVLASAALAVAPGPDNIYVLMQSMVHGRKSGIATVLGLMSGCLVHTTLVAFGVSVIIKQNEILFTILKVFGALYLLYLAYSVYRSSDVIDLSNNKVSKKSFKSLFVQGFFMNVLNPKVSIFFLAFFPGFLFSNSINSIYQLYILGGIFIIVSFFVFLFIVLLASKVASYIMTHKNIGLLFKWLQIIVFITIAFFIFV